MGHCITSLYVKEIIEVKWIDLVHAKKVPMSGQFKLVAPVWPATSLTSYQLTCMLGEKRVTFFSFWISDATPEIPTRDFELVRWTLRTLQRIAHRYWHQCFFSFYEKMSTQDKQIMDQHENKLEYHHQRNFAKHQFRKGSNIEKEPIRL